MAKPLPPTERWRPEREPTVLATTAGFVDTVGFVGLYGLFTAHVTGNLVVAGAQLAGGNAQILAKLLALPVFIGAVMATTLWVHLDRNNPRLLGHLIMTEVVLLSACMAAGVGLAPMRGPDGFNTLLTGLLGVAAMGIRNGASRLLLGGFTPSTIMTGNVTQVAIDLTTLLDRHDDDHHDARRRLRRTLPAVLGFTLGAALGAGGYATVGFACLILPIAASIGLALHEYRSVERKSG